MKRKWVAALLIASVVALVTAAPNAEERRGVLAPLSKGQRVGIDAKDGGYTVTIMAGVPLGYTVTEVGTDYLVAEDIARVTEIRIPLYSIKAVRVTKLPGGKPPAPQPGR